MTHDQNNKKSSLSPPLTNMKYLPEACSLHLRSLLIAAVLKQICDSLVFAEQSNKQI